MNRRSFFAAGVATAMTMASPTTAAPPGQNDLPPGLARALADYNQATIRKDIARLSALVTDDYMLINSDGSVQAKASYLADFRVPGFQLEPYVIEQPVSKVHGQTALTGGIFQLHWTQDGKRQDRKLRIAHFWVKQEGRWRIEYTQLTRAPE